MVSIRRALVLSFIERYLLTVISLASYMMLARLLTPDQIGLYSVSLAVIGIAQVLREFGVGNFLIQERQLTDGHVRTAFGISLFIGATVFCAVWTAAPAIASFYGEARMVSTLRISSLNFLVVPFGSVSLALLRREMAFGRLMWLTLASSVAGVAASNGLAWHGFGQDSMAVGAVVMNIAMASGAWVAGRDHPLPLRPSLTEWRALVRFGAQSSATNVVTAISMDINDLVLGKILGFAPVAMISRAQGVMNVFHRDIMTAVRNVAFPAFAEAHRAGVALEPKHVSSIGSVTALGWPFYAFASLFAPELLHLLFGSQWTPAATLVPIFCLAGASAAASGLATSTLLAAGRIDVVTRVEMVVQPLRALAIVTAVIVMRTVEACAFAYLASMLTITPVMYLAKHRSIPNDWPALATCLWGSLKLTGLSMIGPFAIAAYAGLDRQDPMALGWFTAAAITAIVGWLFAVRVIQHPLSTDPLFMRATRRVPGLA